MTELRAVEWLDGGPSGVPTLRLLDQTLLPAEERHFDCTTVAEVVDAVQRLVVRGAPALGAVGAFGVAIAIAEGEREGWAESQLHAAIDQIREARPTAVNLAIGVDRVRHLVPGGSAPVLAEAHVFFAEDGEANRLLSRHGADWILANVTTRPVRVLTHCNTGALATTAWGTALGIVRELHARGELALVYADETRPLLQGSRLTAWELQREGIDHLVQVDGAAASTILRGLVDVAIIGADRIADNGDTANKIGSVGVALAAREAGIPFVVAAPTTTVDPDTATGDEIEIELRDGSEVTALHGTPTAPADSPGFNPAFDVTPARLISAIVTERGVVEPTAATSLRAEIIEGQIDG